MKKFLALMLAVFMIVSFAACRGNEAPTGASSSDVPSDTSAPNANESENPSSASENQVFDVNAINGKIAIITGTVSQGEEEFQAAQQMVQRYGSDKILTATYPDQFSTETEATISTIANFANDPEVKAIIICQAVPGTSAAIDKIHETRDDILIIAGTVAEPPADISSKADVVMNIDDPGTGYTIPQQAKKQGAEVFIHYSFPRHLSYETIALRRDILKAEFEKLGIQFVEVTAPDPTGDAGVPGSQQFIIEDIPRQIEKYGKNVSFYSTNCAMQEPLIRTVAENGGILTQQCCPSPYHGYPSAFGINVPADKAGDVNYMLEQTKLAVAEKGNSGRMSTWTVPVNMLMIETATEYAKAYLNEEIEKVDMEKFTQIANSIAECEVSTFNTEATGELPNYFLIISEFYEF